MRNQLETNFDLLWEGFEGVGKGGKEIVGDCRVLRGCAASEK